MVKYTLHYFDELRGRGELIRLLLHVGGFQWEDRRIPFADWPTVKPTTPLGQVPYVTVDDGTMMVQSIAIARFLATEAGLVASNAFDRAKEDALIDELWDIHRNLGLRQFAAKTDEEKDEYLEKFKTASTALLTRLAKYCSGDFFGGSKLSWLDLQFMDLWNTWETITPEIKTEFAKCNARVERIRNQPKVKEFYATHPVLPF